jgi:hypothetical protein
MALALRAGNLNQIAVGELGRTGQNRTGDLDLIMTRKTADNAVRRVVDGRELCTELCERRDFDLFDQVGEHVVKETDLLVIEASCIAEIEIGHAPENLGAPIARACGENMFEFVDNGRGLRHFSSWAGFFPPPFTDWRGCSPTRRRTITMARKAKVKSADMGEFPKSLGFKITYGGDRLRFVGSQSPARRRLLRLNIALFDNTRPFGDFSFYILTKLDRCHCHGCCAFALKLRLQFG